MRSASRACRSPGTGPRRRRGRRRAARSTCSGGIPPARRICGGSVQKSTIVLSTPIGQARRRGSRRDRDRGGRPGRRRTCAAVVGLTAAEPVRRRRGEPGAGAADQFERQRMRRDPQSDRVAAARHLVEHAVGAGEQDGERSGPRERGEAPGAGRARRAPSRRAGRRRARWTISGCPAGRPLTSKIRRTAAGFVASAASPYTVSVGIATSPPRSIAATARSTSVVTG